MSDILRRSLAPITEEAWGVIDEEATRVLKNLLSARSLVDFDGPHGWDLAAINLGRLDIHANEPVDGVQWGQRQVLALLELRTLFALGQFELDNITRNSKTPDLEALDEAARKVALFEDDALYNGFAEGGVQGILEASPHDAVALPKEVEGYTKAVGAAVKTLREAGIEGPYALVLPTDDYHTLMTGQSQGGYPTHRAVRDIIEGDIHWSEALKNGVVLSTRGGDYEMTVGQDLAIGYSHQDGQSVHLYITESFTFRAVEPAAAVVLKA